MHPDGSNSKFGNRRTTVALLVAVAFAFPLTYATNSALASAIKQASQMSKSERWIHVRVVNKDASGEMVRVNVPLELAEKVLPTIHHKNLHNGRVTIGNHAHAQDVDFRALLEAVRSSRDGEFVTVESKQNDVRVAKQTGYLVVHVQEHGGARAHRVEVRMPLVVVNALLSGAKDELDLVAGIHALAGQPDTELVTVQDNENTVRVWLDSKNSAD